GIVFFLSGRKCRQTIRTSSFVVVPTNPWGGARWVISLGGGRPFFYEVLSPSFGLGQNEALYKKGFPQNFSKYKTVGTISPEKPIINNVL
ncbi:hypothetical protein, partial [Ralstonia solanacearum]|uniref:hypothetical protein n=1 Tax=Ralstonia solanacearum TaxID=305 RepID=UPI0019D3DA18